MRHLAGLSSFNSPPAAVSKRFDAVEITTLQIPAEQWPRCVHYPSDSLTPWRLLIFLFCLPSSPCLPTSLSLSLSLSAGSLTPCLYKFPDHGLGSSSYALSHGFSSLPSAFLSTDEAPGGPGVGEVKADGQRKNMRDAEDAPAMDSPQIRELEMFANDFKIRRIKLGENQYNNYETASVCLQVFDQISPSF